MPASFGPDDDNVIRERAAAWFARRQSGTWTTDDAEGLSGWLAADARHRHEYDQLAALWSAVGDLADSPVVRAERSAGRPSPPWWRPAWRPALSFALLVVAAVGLARLLPWTDTAKSQAIATGLGERREIALDDGSRIQLDADSALTIYASGSRQTVILERGEAFFTVAHRPERRFEVDAGPARIVDIGTRFGVSRVGAQVLVDVTEGSVEVGAGADAAPRPLTAGQAATITADGTVGHPFASDGEAAFAWRDGRLVFDRTPLREAVARVNRYWRKPLAVVDPELAGLQLSGSFRIDDADGLLWAMEQTLPLRAVERGGRIELVAATSQATDTPAQLIR